MPNITNNSANNIVLGTAQIPAGAVGVLDDDEWKALQDVPSVKALLKGEAIAVGGKVAKNNPSENAAQAAGGNAKV